MLRLVQVRVDKLLGRFDHVVNFPASWEFVILHGPNGVGKTKLLELINGALSGQLRVPPLIPFREAIFTFDDASKLVVERLVDDTPEDRPSKNRPRARSKWTTRLTLIAPSGGRTTWKTSGKMSPETFQRVRSAIRELPVDMIDPDTYDDHFNGDVLTFQGLTDRYGAQLPFDFTYESGIPDEFRELFANLQVHLIETQRLLSLPPATRSARVARIGATGPTNAEYKVAQYATDLTRRLREALAQNSRRSQELDRSFPGRLLEDRTATQITEDQIREKYNAQLEFRNQLAEIDVLGSSEYLPLPDRQLEEWERRVLWTYLDDAEKKLVTFRDVLDRVRLLREIVNSRFRYKKLRIDREQGFVFVTEEGHEVPPDQLSSGEQHELVLVYNLLFQVKENSLVLIDEPEISLHVGWQRQFLTDMLEISRLASLRFVVATHSPQIVHKWWDRTLSLAPSEDVE